MRSSLEVAREVYPPVADCKLARGWAGLEAFMPDDLPVLGPVPGLSGLLVAAGFSGHGFALSPLVGDILARLALGHDARIRSLARPPARPVRTRERSRELTRSPPVGDQRRWHSRSIAEPADSSAT